MNRTPATPASDRLALERYIIPNLRNACRILKLLETRAEGFKAADVARELAIPVTTTLRIMATLQLEGLVRKLEGRFELGPALIHLGNASLAGTEIRAMAMPVLQQLTAETVETSHLAIPCDNRALIVAVQDSPHPLRAASRPGYLAELHCSSTGKVFLAFLHARDVGSIVGKEPLLRRTPNTLTSLADVRRETELTRRRGYSLDNEEYHPGVRCVAAPVYSCDATVVAAIGITAATVRFPKENVGRISKLVLAAAQELSRHLGYHGKSGSAQ